MNTNELGGVHEELARRPSGFSGWKCWTRRCKEPNLRRLSCCSLTTDAEETPPRRSSGQLENDVERRRTGSGSVSGSQTRCSRRTGVMFSCHFLLLTWVLLTARVQSHSWRPCTGTRRYRVLVSALKGRSHVSEGQIHF